MVDLSSRAARSITYLKTMRASIDVVTSEQVVYTVDITLDVARISELCKECEKICNLTMNISKHFDWCLQSYLCFRGMFQYIQ